MKKKKQSAFRQKIYLMTGALTVAALVAMIGVYRNMEEPEGKLVQGQQSQMAQNPTGDDGTQGQSGLDSQQSQVALGQEDIDYGPGSGIAYDLDEYGDWSAVAQGEDIHDTQAVMAERQQAQREEGKEGSSLQNSDQETAAASAQKEDLSFAGSINWPVQGNVLMNYSMDQSIYFATLDQYKRNPAVIIQASVGDKVLVGVSGRVVGVETNENTGKTVTVDLGDGYQAIYGQLKEVKKTEGDMVSSEDILGYIAEPTKYYSIEGSNLYFAMTKDGNPVNPMEYLK